MSPHRFEKLSRAAVARDGERLFRDPGRLIELAATHGTEVPGHCAV
jgi:hypothetical protein